MKLRIAALAAAGVLGASAFAAGSIAGPEYKNQYPSQSTQTPRDCGDGDTVTYAGPDKLWPPNHKLQAASVTATDGDSESTVALELLDNAEDYVDEPGSGGPNHDPDVVYTGETANTDTGEGSATVPFQLRAERSGQAKDGRTYTIHWAAEFDNGGKACTSADSGQEPFTVFVPHDMGDPADRAGRTNGK